MRCVGKRRGCVVGGGIEEEVSVEAEIDSVDIRLLDSFEGLAVPVFSEGGPANTDEASLGIRSKRLVGLVDLSMVTVGGARRDSTPYTMLLHLCRDGVSGADKCGREEV